MKDLQIISIISYGKYSKLFLNYLRDRNNNQDLQNYLALLRAKWTIKNEKLLSFSKRLLKKTKNSGLRFLIMTTMMHVAEIVGDTDLNKNLYNELIRKFYLVPPAYRKLVGQAIKSNYALSSKQMSKEFRLWSKLYTEDEAGIAVLLNTKGRKELKEEKIEESMYTFYEVYEYARKYPHPTYILAGLNNAVWYSRKLKRKDYLQPVNLLLYNCGYYFDNESAVINSFDTALTILRENKEALYFEFVDIMLNFYEKLLGKDVGYKEKFVKAIKQAKQLSLSKVKQNGRKDEVANTRRLQKFIKERIKNINSFSEEVDISVAGLYKLLNGENKNIKIETLKKVVGVLGLEEFSFDYPHTINFIIQVIKEEEAFIKNRDRVSAMSTFELKSLFLKGFMTLVFLEGIDLSKLFKLAEKDHDKLFKFIHSDPRLIALFNRCVQYEYEPESVNSFYKARLDLVNKLFSEMKDMVHISSLIRLYDSVESIDDFEKLNVYFRQYVRYSTTQWRFDVEDVMDERFSDTDYERIADFCRELGISELFGYLCAWEFEGAEHERLVVIFSEKVERIKNKQVSRIDDRKPACQSISF